MASQDSPSARHGTGIGRPSPMSNWTSSARFSLRTIPSRRPCLTVSEAMGLTMSWRVLLLTQTASNRIDDILQSWRFHSFEFLLQNQTLEAIHFNSDVKFERISRIRNWKVLFFSRKFPQIDVYLHFFDVHISQELSTRQRNQYQFSIFRVLCSIYAPSLLALFRSLWKSRWIFLGNFLVGKFARSNFMKTERLSSKTEREGEQKGKETKRAFCVERERAQ